MEYPFLLMQSPSEYFANPTYFHTNWSEPLLLKFLPNAPPEIEIANPLDLDSLEGVVRLELNITDDTLVRTTELLIDSLSWVNLQYNSSLELWVMDINTTEYDLGLHMFRFRAIDASDVVTMDEVQVLFVDLTLPIIQNHADITYFNGDVGNSIIWNCTDSRPDSYQILQNGTEIESGDWNTSIITLSVDGLDVGVYNFTLVVFDDAGHYASDVVIVEVRNAWIEGINPLLPVGILISLAGGFVLIIVLKQVKKRRERKQYHQF
jgi:hypothetical protein